MLSHEAVGKGYQRAVSIFILFVLAMQTYVSVIPGGDDFWPFIDYPMYQRKHREGERVDVGHSVYATFADGSEVKIGPADVGTTHFKFQGHVARALVHGRENSWKPLIQQFEKRRNVKIIRLRVENYPMVITKEGGRPAPAEVLKVVELMGEAQP
ncbi:MAG: hypothetical protein ACREVK_07690 [Gammaproteobacteria bacterium]